MNASLEKTLRSLLEQHGYQILDPIGNGGFSTLYLVHSERYNSNFAVKVVEIKNVEAHFLSEITMIMKLPHPNIINMYEYWCEGNFCFIVLEYCPGGSIDDLIHASGPIKKPRLYRYISEILTALCFCHDRHIAHRDVKPGNILLNRYGKIKLVDFGISQLCVESKTNHFEGSPQFMAPELFLEEAHDPIKADIWALGITIYGMATGKLPWSNLKKKQLSQIIPMGILPDPIPDDIELTRVIYSMLSLKPEKRPTASELQNLSIFKVGPNIKKTNSISPSCQAMFKPHCFPNSSQKFINGKFFSVDTFASHNRQLQSFLPV